MAHACSHVTLPRECLEGGLLYSEYVQLVLSPEYHIPGII